MTRINADLVRRKLSVIARNLEDLAAVAEQPLESYLEDRLRRKAAERLLQELIEAAVDVNVQLLRATGAPVPGDYYSSFTELGRAGVIPHALAERLAPAAGLRNRIVHEYDDLDDAIVHESVRRVRRRFPEYVRAVERYLGGQGV